MMRDLFRLATLNLQIAAMQLRIVAARIERWRLMRKLGRA